MNMIHFSCGVVDQVRHTYEYCYAQDELNWIEVPYYSIGGKGDPCTSCKAAHVVLSGETDNDQRQQDDKPSITFDVWAK